MFFLIIFVLLFPLLCDFFFSFQKLSKCVTHFTQLGVVLRFCLYCSESSMKFLAFVWFQRKWKKEKTGWTKIKFIFFHLDYEGFSCSLWNWLSYLIEIEIGILKLIKEPLSINHCLKLIFVHITNLYGLKGEYVKSSFYNVIVTAIEFYALYSVVYWNLLTLVNL